MEASKCIVAISERMSESKGCYSTSRNLQSVKYLHVSPKPLLQLQENSSCQISYILKKFKLKYKVLMPRRIGSPSNLTCKPGASKNC